MSNRLRLLLILAGAFFVAATFTYPQWRSLLEREAFEDLFPGLNSTQQEAFLALPTEQQGAFYDLMATADATMVAGLVRAAIQPPIVIPTAEQEMPQMTNPTVFAVSNFREIDPIRKGSGTVTIYQLPDNNRILRFEDFAVTNGPDLHVILTRRPDPRTAADVGTDYVDLGPLKGNVGAQHYSIPAQVSFSQYQGVVIYSVEFQVVFTTAPLA